MEIKEFVEKLGKDRKEKTEAESAFEELYFGKLTELNCW